MNLSLSAWNPLATRRHEPRDEEINDWLGGEAWVTPQRIDLECDGDVEAPRHDDPANDWVPL